MAEQYIYHEKQKMLFCAKHALNNLYQKKEFTSHYLDEICDQLTKTKFLLYNPHRNLFKLDKALQQKGHTIQWFDMRKDVREVKLIEDQESIFGLILNVQYQNTLDKIMGCNTHHWIAIKVINNVIYNLDSKKNAPQIMKDLYFYEFLQDVKQNNGQILIVRNLDYDKLQSDDIKEEQNKEEVIEAREEQSYESV